MSERAILLNLPKSRPINISFENITFTVTQGSGKAKEKRQVIKGVTGEFRSGELTAIMGPSGAGKSSLLNILTGFQMEGMGGSVSSNGTERKQKSGAFKKESCYIMQDDHLSPLFTVLEIMTMAADLKLGNSLSDKAKLIVIEDILDTLGLSHTKDTRCERLSGGQKKRLSIALELIDNPPIMFLDEPTTGLDSAASLQCIKVLKALAKGGRTIVCTIHQPSASVFEMFDHVYILAGGYCVYQGSSNNTVPYLQSVGLPCPQYHNPADFISEVANGDYGNFSQQLAISAQDSRWRGNSSISTKSEEAGEKEDQRTTVLIQPPSEWTKLWVLLYRNMIQLHRDWTVTHLKLILHFLVGVLLGLNYMGSGMDGSKTLNNVGFVFCTIIYLSYTSMMPAVLKFPSELAVIKKERFNNWYSLRTYYAAFILTNTPVQLLFCSVYVGFAYYLSSQPLDIWRFSMFLSVCMLVTLISEGLGLYLGTFTDILYALFWGSLFVAYLLIYSGVLALFPQMSVYLYSLSYFCFGRYAFDSLILSVYGYGRAPLDCPDDMMYCHLRFPEKIMTEMGVEDGRFWIDFFAMFANLIIFRVLAFYALKRKISIGQKSK